MKSLYPSRLAQTPVGLGLFATADLPAATAVEQFKGPELPFEQIQEDDIRYALLIDGGWIVPQSNARYINHSCDANCYISDTAEVITARMVSEGEELTVMYNGVSMAEFINGTEDNFWDERWTFRCECGSRRCIGLINRYVVNCPDDSNSRNVYLGVTKGKGRGVFARVRIAAGQTIETAPVIVIPAGQWSNIENTVLFDYTFEWGWEGEEAAIAGGYGSFYNHSYEPNARYERDLENAVIEIIALRDIEQGEEIVLNYNGAPGNLDPLWFPAY